MKATRPSTARRSHRPAGPKHAEPEAARPARSSTGGATGKEAAAFASDLAAQASGEDARFGDAALDEFGASVATGQGAQEAGTARARLKAARAAADEGRELPPDVAGDLLLVGTALEHSSDAARIGRQRWERDMKPGFFANGFTRRVYKDGVKALDGEVELFERQSASARGAGYGAAAAFVHKATADFEWETLAGLLESEGLAMRAPDGTLDLDHEALAYDAADLGTAIEESGEDLNLVAEHDEAWQNVDAELATQAQGQAELAVWLTAMRARATAALSKATAEEAAEVKELLKVVDHIAKSVSIGLQAHKVGKSLVAEGWSKGSKSAVEDLAGKPHDLAALATRFVLGHDLRQQLVGLQARLAGLGARSVALRHIADEQELAALVASYVAGEEHAEAAYTSAEASRGRIIKELTAVAASADARERAAGTLGEGEERQVAIARRMGQAMAALPWQSAAGEKLGAQAGVLDAAHEQLTSELAAEPSIGWIRPIRHAARPIPGVLGEASETIGAASQVAERREHQLQELVNLLMPALQAAAP